MKKLIGLTLVSAIVLAACGNSPGTAAATANGTRITVGEVNDLIHVESGTIGKPEFANFLGLLVEWTIVSRAVGEEFGISATEDEITAEADRIFDQFGGGQSREEFTSSRGVTERFLRMVAHQEILYRQLSEKFLDDGRGIPSDDEIAEQLEAVTVQMTEVCVAHILLGQLQTLEGEELTQARQAALAEAEDVLELLQAGGDFAELAQEHSEDANSAVIGGDLGCSSPTRYVEGFREGVMLAPIGAFHPEPVLSEFGYHIILVESRTVPTEDEVVEAIKSDAAAGELDTWITDTMRGAQVEVVERFGTWDQTTLQVVPPAT